MALGPGHRCVGKSHDDISVCATPLAVSQLSCFVSLSAPKPINSLRPDLALADRTNFELILLLSEQEWQWRPLPAKKEDRFALEYKHNQPRLWYTQSETPHKLYMVALLSAADIFAKGIVACWSSPSKSRTSSSSSQTFSSRAMQWTRGTTRVGPNVGMRLGGLSHPGSGSPLMPVGFLAPLR